MWTAEHMWQWRDPAITASALLVPVFPPDVESAAGIIFPDGKWGQKYFCMKRYDGIVGLCYSVHTQINTINCLSKKTLEYSNIEDIYNLSFGFQAKDTHIRTWGFSVLLRDTWSGEAGNQTTGAVVHEHLL